MDSVKWQQTQNLTRDLVLAWVAGAKTKDPTITLVNCTVDRRRDQESDNQSASLHRWQAHTPTFLKCNLVNCTEGGRKDQQFENQFGQLHGWQAQRTRMQLDPTITLTLVNCTGGRQTRDPTINPTELHRWQAQTPSFSKSTWSTARWQAQRSKKVLIQAIP